MWSIEQPSTGTTNKFTVPTDGVINIVRPEGVKVSAFINDVPVPEEHVHVKAGDIVHFHIIGKAYGLPSVALEYAGSTSYVPASIITANAVIEMKEDMTPTDSLNLFAGTNGMNSMGGGLGAGLVGGLLGNVLLRNNGLNGVDGANSPLQTTAIMQTLGDIKAAIPLAEGQVQLALAGAQMDLNNSISQNTASVIGAVGAGNAAIMNNLNMQTQMNTKGFADNTAAVLNASNLNLLATKEASLIAERNAWTLSQSINNDGDKTRALIQSIDKTNDSRLITTLANEITELKGDRRLAHATGDININNNNTATAISQQQQSQQQFQILANLNAQIANLANDIQAVRQSSVVFNSGRMTDSGNQSAANTRVA